MKSPKNVVKALLLTSLIVSSISAMGDDHYAASLLAPAVNAAAEAAAPEAAVGFFGSACNYLKDTAAAHPNVTKGLAVTAAAGTLGGLIYKGYKNSWAGRAWNNTKAATSAAYNWVKTNPIKSATAVAAAAATGAAAYFCPEQREAVVNGLKSGLGWTWGKTKDAYGWVKENPIKSASAAVAVPAVGFGSAKLYRYFRPAGEVVPADDSTSDDLTSTEDEDQTPAPAVMPTPAKSAPVVTAQDENQAQTQTLGAVVGQKQTSPRKAYSAEYSKGLAEILKGRNQQPAATRNCSTGRCSR